MTPTSGCWRGRWSSARSTSAGGDIAERRERRRRRCSSRRRSARSRRRVRAGARAAPGPTAWSATSARPSACSPRRARDERFIGGHPLAGAETSGVEHAREDLFDGAVWYLTPAANSTGVLYERLHRLLTTIGARAGGDRRRDARPTAGSGLAPAARARQPARGAGGERARRRRRAPRAGASGRAFATRRAWRAPTARSGRTSTWPTATR